MQNFEQYLTFFNILFTICTAIGGFMAFRNSRRHGTFQAQQEIIQTLQAQVTVLKDEIDRMKEHHASDVADLKLQIERLKEQNMHQGLIIETIQAALKQRGIHVTIDGETITISDDTPGEHKKVSGKTTTTRVQTKGNTPLP